MATDPPGAAPGPIFLDVWGGRGSRSLQAGASRIGTRTPCFSLRWGEALFVFEAGRGLAALGDAMLREERLRGVRRIHVLVSHAHLDHWEGLKDVEWFWRLGNGLVVTLYANAETQEIITRGFAHPSFVPLEVLAEISVAGFRRCELPTGHRLEIEGCRLSTHALHHYSGPPEHPNFLDAMGFRLEAPDGPVVCTLLDHEPSESTREAEEEILRGCDLAVYDSHVLHRWQQWAHGSQEHTATMAGRHPATLFLAAHLSPALSDGQLEEGRSQYAEGRDNFRLAEEGATWWWSPAKGRFVEPAEESEGKAVEGEAAGEPAARGGAMNGGPEEREERLSRLRHDLRTPVNHIIGYAELLLEEAREGGLEDLVPDLEKIRDAGRALQEMLEKAFADPAYWAQ